MCLFPIYGSHESWGRRELGVWIPESWAKRRLGIQTPELEGEGGQRSRFLDPEEGGGRGQDSGIRKVEENGG